MRVTTTHHSCLCLWTYSAAYTGNRHRSGSTDTVNGLSIPVSSDCLLSNQETPTISLFTDSPPSETSMLLFLTAIKSQNKSSWICPLFYFIPISPLLYKTAWKNYFYAHHCQFLSSNLCWILLGQVISWLDYHYNICNVFFIVCLFSSNLLIPLFYYFIFWQCLIM